MNYIELKPMIKSIDVTIIGVLIELYRIETKYSHYSTMLMTFVLIELYRIETYATVIYARS